MEWGRARREKGLGLGGDGNEWMRAHVARPAEIEAPAHMEMGAEGEGGGGKQVIISVRKIKQKKLAWEAEQSGEKQRKDGM